jgi:DNA invertase Pin-like site-specific DNA recombinase
MNKKNQSQEISAGSPLLKAVAYARVSSKEQEKEGFSIPAQQKLIKSYAEAHQITVVKEFVDVETAKASGRANFEEMLRYLKTHSTVRIVLVEKTDRLYRNLKDWVHLDELQGAGEVAIHFVKEGVVLSNDSKSAEKLIHGIKVLMAKNYIDNLSEEARKGMQEKAEQGIWPTVAPLGYLNVMGPEGKKIITLDPKSAPVIGQLFMWYATGTISLKEAAVRARAAGLVHRRSGAPLPVSKVHTILRNRIYTGEFEWKGHRFKGKHDPIVSHELWARVQGALDARQKKKPKHGKRDFAFSGLIACGHCGCALVGETKKGRYTYYHCTGFKGKCDEPYVREEVLEERFSDQLARLSFDDEVLSWIKTGLLQSHADEEREHKEAIARLQAEYDRLGTRIHAMYVDKLDGRIDAAFFSRLSDQWRSEQETVMREIALHTVADASYLEQGVQLLDLASKAHRLFAKQEPSEKRHLLNFVLSNSTWKDGELSAAFRQPFDLLAETTAIAAARAAGGGVVSTDRMVWLPGPDSNQRPTG